MKTELNEWFDARTSLAEDETGFHAQWSEHVAGETDPFRMAARGGLLADRFPFIFSAGYQAALRHVFPSLLDRDWAAFAVSEGRDDLPGVTYTEGADGVRLTGFKTWVAASALCADLVVSANGDAGWRYFHLRADAPGVDVTTRPRGRVLPDLSQGQAELSSAVAAPAPTDRVESFGPSEVLFIYTAFLASSWGHFPKRRDDLEAVLDQAQSRASSLPVEWDDEMHALDRAVQATLRSLREGECADDALWRRDYKLVAMYSKADD